MKNKKISLDSIGKEGGWMLLISLFRPTKEYRSAKENVKAVLQLFFTRGVFFYLNIGIVTVKITFGYFSF